MLFVGTLRSKIVNHPMLPEVGFFEQPLYVEPAAFEYSGDRRQFLLKQISRMTAEQIFLTGIPAESWTFEFSPAFQRGLAFPSPTLTFDGSSL